MRVWSPAFGEGTWIPPLHTCKGKDRSPELRIEGVPAGAAALALVADDPDAPRGTWTHWTAWDLPAATARIPEGAPASDLGGVEGVTSAKATGYHGPCPPSGVHRYFFRVYALDRSLGLARGASVEQLRKAMEGHVVATAHTMGRFATE